MILNKKGLAVLPLAALLFATSCSKQISYKDAVAFVDKTYTSTEAKTPTKIIREFSGKGADETSKNFVRFCAVFYGFEELDENLHFKGEMPIQGTIPPIKSNQLPVSDPDEGVEVTYTLKGKSLTVTSKQTIDQTEIAELHEAITSLSTYNDQGYSTKMEFKQSIKGSVDDPTTSEAKTIVVDCSYNYTYTITF